MALTFFQKHHYKILNDMKANSSKVFGKFIS